MQRFGHTSLLFAAVFTLAACGSEPDTQDAATGADTASPPEPQLTFAELTGDASAGERAYGKCRACHVLEEGRSTVGPTLYGVVGREAGAIGGFNYSEANATAEVTWTPEVLFDYLESPREFMPGTRMAFAGIKDAQERADLIAFLETQGN